MVVGAAVVGGATWGVAFVAKPEHVALLDANVEVAGDGSAHVIEIVGYRFTGVNKHGIYRDVPGVDPTHKVTAIDGGRPAEVDLSLSDTPQGVTAIRVGNPNHTVTGDHVYQLDYELRTVLRSNGQLAWNGVGPGWTVDVDHAALGRERTVDLDRPAVRPWGVGGDRRMHRDPTDTRPPRRANQRPRAAPERHDLRGGGARPSPPLLRCRPCRRWCGPRQGPRRSCPPSRPASPR